MYDFCAKVAKQLDNFANIVDTVAVRFHETYFMLEPLIGNYGLKVIV